LKKGVPLIIIIIVLISSSLLNISIAEYSNNIIYVDDNNTEGPWGGTEKHSLDYENDYRKEIQLKGECYDFFETHHLGQLNHIGPFWFSSPSSVMTLRFREDFELIMDGIVQDIEPPMTIFILRFSGFCPMPIQYRNINGSKEITLNGFCEAIRCSPIVEEDTIHESPLFSVSDFLNFGQTAYGLTHNDFNKDGFIDFAVSSSTDPWTESRISIFYNEENVGFIQDDVYVYDNNIRYIRNLDSGDFDADGDIDLMFTYTESIDVGGGLMMGVNGTVNLLFNNGWGDFIDETMIARHCSDKDDEYPRINPRISSADFDADGDLDFVVGDNSGIVEFYKNDGSGGFTSNGIIHDYGQLSWGLTSGDFDCDGDTDIIVAAEYENERGYGRICLKRNRLVESNGLICFENGSGEDLIYIHSGRGSCSLDAIDYDRDGLLDFVAGMTSVTVFRNTGNSFDFFYVGELPGEDGHVDHLYYGGMTSFDMDLDGLEDLITGGVQGMIRFCLNNFSELPPLKPSISGETYFVGDINHEFEYSIYSKDINGDVIYYFVDWGDGTDSGWIGPYESGEEVIVNHVWGVHGTHKIQVQAKDVNNQMSRIKELQLTFLRKNRSWSFGDRSFLVISTLLAKAK